MSTPPNVLLIVLDSVRRDSVSAYGYERETTPFLEKFTKSATIYTEARSSARWSLPSHVSMFTGRNPYEHQAFETPTSIDTSQFVFSNLPTAYQTGLFTYNPHLTSWAIPQAFDTAATFEYELPFPEARDPQAETTLFDLATGEAPVRSLLNQAYLKAFWDYPWLVDRYPPQDKYIPREVNKWIRERERPWFACVNLMDAHSPYTPEPEYDRWSDGASFDQLFETSEAPYDMQYYRGKFSDETVRTAKNLYDGAIRQADARVESIIDTLRDTDAYDDTLIIVTSDHGEGFADASHLYPESVDIWAHHVGCHERHLEVPLLVKHPGQRDGNQIDELSALEEFPSVFIDAIDGINSDFTTSRLYAYSNGIHAVKEWFPAIEGPYDTPMLIKYETAEGRLTRKSHWDGQSGVLDISTGMFEFRDTVTGELQEDFDRMEVRPITSDSAEMDVQTQERLKDLGYL
ncbi:sulfatase-like hydrolase/transferase [Salarchaeum japonicum]|uniref:sulfatase-like hydrolase/transferase n=1 Tax=Salarchaeum japonicum TaxID=555573 RepID=UPI003C75F472